MWGSGRVVISGADIPRDKVVVITIGEPSNGMTVVTTTVPLCGGSVVVKVVVTLSSEVDRIEEDVAELSLEVD